MSGADSCPKRIAQAIAINNKAGLIAHECHDLINESYLGGKILHALNHVKMLTTFQERLIVTISL